MSTGNEMMCAKEIAEVLERRGIAVDEIRGVFKRVEQMRKIKRLRECFDHIAGILDGTDGLASDDKLMLCTTFATVFNLHLESEEK